MFIINSLMKYVGNDYINYYRYFHNIVEGRPQEVEKTYKLICMLVWKLGLDFQWVYVIYCLIAYTLLAMCIRKYSKNYAFSYLMFYFSGFFALLGLNQIRQFVSVMLIFYGYSFIKEKKLIPYVICVLLATAFHFTSIVMLPFYWILNKKWRLSIFAVIAVVLAPINFFYTEVMGWLFATFLPRYLNTNYMTREFNLDIPYLAMVIFTLIICLIYRKNADKEVPMWHNGVILSVLIGLLGSWVPEYKRFIYFFFIGSITYVTELIEKEENKKVKWGLYGAILLVYMWYYSRATNEWGIYPYRSIFDF